MDSASEIDPAPGPVEPSQPVTLALIYNALTELKELVLDLEARVASIEHGH